MTKRLTTSVLIIAIGSTVALAKDLPLPPSSLPIEMEVPGKPLKNAVTPLPPLIPDGLDIPLAQFLDIAQQPVRDLATSARSAKDAEIYRTIAPSVVEVRTKDALGSGSLVSSSGEILTNWHVVAGNEVVAIVYKPAIEGAKPGPNEMKLGRVVKYDQESDLALVKAAEVPSGRLPIRLGDPSEIVIGEDVRAIGHPHQNDWSLTKGIISQYRRGYVWAYGSADAGMAGVQPIKHKADVIQTQTPINPGNSGGPLISDSGTLIGVNTAGQEGEGLNFAVSVEDVTRFLAEPTKANAEAPKTTFEPKEMGRFRNKENNAAVISYDLNCSGKVNADYIVPDRKTEAITLRWDRNGDGRVDVVFFDFKRRGKWDLSFWDANFEGRYTLVGYHDDGSLKPTRFESYADFQKRLAAR
jgi:S1-C subfamily serine protease